MALFKFIANIFKKIKKLFGGGKKKGQAGGAERLPGERRIGIYGPSNVGKSVFFTMLYKACKTGRDFRLDPDDHQTGLQLVNNLNTLRSGEWLPGTVEEQELNFKAAIRGGSQFPFSTRDYKGETVDLEQEGAAKEKLIEYFQDCDAILFLLSPEMIADARKCEREIMSFTAMINQVTESGGRGLKIPIGLMITKADAIDGFEEDKQVALVSRKAEYLKAKDFDEFVEGICGQYHIARNIVFQEQVRDILKRLNLFFDFLMTLSMEFQVFFVSSVGHVRKVEGEDGKTSMRPPEDPDGIGVKEPFLWVIETIRRREKIAAFNGFRRFVFRLAMVVLVFYSVFYGWHFILHDRASLIDMQNSPNVPQSATIQEELEAERDRWVVKYFHLFPLPGAKAGEIPKRAANLSATYAAHRYLAEELPALDGAPALEELSTGWASGSWKTAHPWYADLIGTEASKVEDAIRARIHGHNLDVAREIARLGADEGGEIPTEERRTRCQEMVEKQFVRPPGGGSDYEDLVAQSAEICERMELNAADRELAYEYDSIIESFQEDIAPYVPSDGDIDALLSDAQDWEDKAKARNSEGLAEKLDTIDALGKILRYMREALAAEEGSSDRRSALDNIQGLARGDLEAGRGWVSKQKRRANERSSQAAREELLAEVHGKLDGELDLDWLFDRGMHSRLRDLRLRGAEKEALDTFLDNVSRILTEGATVKMAIQQAPPNFVVQAWDEDSEEWRGEGAPGLPALDVQWRPGKPVRIAIRKSGGGPICEGERQPLADLDGLEQTIGCGGTGGAPTQVRFSGVDTLVETQLLEPLNRAFPR